MINKLILDTLKPLGVPVSFQKNSSNVNTYITFFVYNENGDLWADNTEAQTNYYVQVDVWSKSDYTNLVNNVVNAMKVNGFTRTSSADLFESDTGIYHKAIRFAYSKNNI